jgi:uncharacterized membrane protein YfcA
MFALSFLVIMLSGFIQGTTSFGFSLIALPLLGIMLSLKLVVPLLVIFSLLMNSIILYNLRSHVDLKRILILICSSVIATPIGAHLLMSVDESKLKLAVGIIVVISAIIFKLGFTFKVKNEKLAFVPVGIISGLLNGSVSLSGPPIILFLTNQKTEKQVFRATLTSFFWILNIATIFVFFYNGLINYEVFNLSIKLIPALIIGLFFGIKLGDRIQQRTFQNATIILLFCMGSLSIMGSF